MTLSFLRRLTELGPPQPHHTHTWQILAGCTLLLIGALGIREYLAASEGDAEYEAHMQEDMKEAQEVRARNVM